LNDMSRCMIDDVGCIGNCFPSEFELHLLGVKHALAHFHNSSILPFKYSILLWSVENNALPRHAMRDEKCFELIIGMFSSTINAYTLTHVLALIFH
jgi:hypothetical protein